MRRASQWVARREADVGGCGCASGGWEVIDIDAVSNREVEIVDMDRVSNHDVEVVDLDAVSNHDVEVLELEEWPPARHRRVERRAEVARDVAAALGSPAGGWQWLGPDATHPPQRVRPIGGRPVDLPPDVQRVLREPRLPADYGSQDFGLPSVLAVDRVLGPLGLQYHGHLSGRVRCAGRELAGMTGGLKWGYAASNATGQHQRVAAAVTGEGTSVACAFVDQLPFDRPWEPNHRLMVAAISLATPRSPTSTAATVAIEPGDGERLAIRSGEATSVSVAMAGGYRALVASHVARRPADLDEDPSGTGGEIWVTEIDDAGVPRSSHLRDLRPLEPRLERISPGVVSGPWDDGSAIVVFAYRASRGERPLVMAVRIVRELGGTWRVEGGLRTIWAELDDPDGLGEGLFSNIACVADEARGMLTVAIASTDAYLWLGHLQPDGTSVRAPYRIEAFAGSESAHSGLLLSLCERTGRYMLQEGHNLWYLTERSPTDFGCVDDAGLPAPCAPELSFEPFAQSADSLARINTHDGFASQACRGDREFRLIAPAQGPFFGGALPPLLSRAVLLDAADLPARVAAEGQPLSALERPAWTDGGLLHASRVVSVPAVDAALVLAVPAFAVADSYALACALGVSESSVALVPPRPRADVRFGVIRGA